MTRALTILAILLLCLIPLLAGLGGNDGEPIKLRGERDLGEGYAYKTETLRRFRKLVASKDWSLGDPPRNPQGMLEAVHLQTGLTFVLIPAGSFQMGSPVDEKGRHPLVDFEGPVHGVTVPAFLLCATECTQSAWERGGGKNESFCMGADRPVEDVSWTECHEWCARNGLRLPSESEWEYACGAGTKTPFSLGQTITKLQVNYDGRFPVRGAPEGGNRAGTAAVRSLPSNPWGLFEMHGNVWEWCGDIWHHNYEGAPTDGSARLTKGTSDRVNRGGSWGDTAWGCRSAVREGGLPSGRICFLGFRPAADLPE